MRKWVKCEELIEQEIIENVAGICNKEENQECYEEDEEGGGQN